MEPTLLIELLEKPLNHNEVQAVLKWYKIRRRPKVKIDTEGSIINFKDWVINSSVGIEFGFEDEISFNGYSSEKGNSMLLTQIYLYGTHKGVKPYQGLLPFNIEISDNRNTVREKLIAWEATRRSYTRDVWELPEYRLTISYENDLQIGFILLWSRKDPITLLKAPIVMPDIKEIIKYLGKNIQDLISSNLFHQLPLKNYQDMETINFRRNYGFKLKFLNNLRLSHIIFYRKGEDSLYGWQGTLPYNLKFNDSPEIVLRKIGILPDIRYDELFIGNVLWDFKDYCIRVNYCTMKNYILSIDLLTWDALDIYNT